MHDSDHIAGIVRGFLANPGDRRCFDAFFAACFHYARGYLAGLARRGYRLPEEHYSDHSLLNDCTIDCLATLFESRPGRPLHLIRDYFRSKIDKATSAAEVTARFKALIAGHIRQELHQIKTAADPQAANIRRSVRRAMAGSDYEEFERVGYRYWACRSTARVRREEHPPPDAAALAEWLIEAVRNGSDMPGRCRSVFRRLGVDDRFQNFIAAHRLLAAMVDVLTEHSGSRPAPFSLPSSEWVQEAIRTAANGAVRDTLADDLPGLAAKRGFTKEECQAHATALADIMADLAEDGDHDLLPRYLKAELTPDGAESYVDHHKYVWETLVAACKGRLRERLRAEGLEP